MAGSFNMAQAFEYLRRINDGGRAKFATQSCQSRQVFQTAYPVGRRLVRMLENMGLYSADRKIVNFTESATRPRPTIEPMVNQALPVPKNAPQAHLSSIDDGDSLSASPLNLCGYLPAFSGQLYHLFSPAARNEG